MIVTTQSSWRLQGLFQGKVTPTILIFVYDGYNHVVHFIVYSSAPHMCHQMPSQFTNGITDYKQCVTFLLIRAIGKTRNYGILPRNSGRAFIFN